MNITVDRYKSDSNTTLGKMSLDGVFECYTLEDEFRAVKVMKETRIPAGRYRVLLRTEGSHHLQYMKLFPEIHKGMLWLQDVPGFQWILIHIGNTEKDTDGCLLVGQTRDEKTMTIQRSTPAYRQMYEKVIAAMDRGEEIWITYQDNDRK